MFRTRARGCEPAHTHTRGYFSPRERVSGPVRILWGCVMQIELMDCTNFLLQEIADKEFKQRHVAKSYALALRSSFDTDWAKVNNAIIERWSLSGLKRIKDWAWSGKCFEEVK